VAASDARRAVEAVWRIESAWLIAALARMVGDLGLAEEFAQDRWSPPWSSGRNRASPTTRAPG
jgi:hypothetical protein